MESFEKSLSCKINKFPTDNGLKFSYRALAEDRRSKNDKAHIFDGFCHSRNIEHRLTQFYHPQTNGMVDQMNRSIKEATVKIYFYKSVTELEEHLKYWLIYYNYEKRLKSLRVMNPYDKFLKEYETNSQILDES